jgi:hypothetical protein
MEQAAEVERKFEQPEPVERLPPNLDIVPPKLYDSAKHEAYTNLFCSVLNGYMSTKFAMESLQCYKINPDVLSGPLIPAPEKDRKQMAAIARIADMAYDELTKRIM